MKNSNLAHYTTVQLFLGEGENTGVAIPYYIFAVNQSFISKTKVVTQMYSLHYLKKNKHIILKCFQYTVINPLLHILFVSFIAVNG